MFVLLLSFPGKWLYLQRKFKNDDFMKKNSTLLMVLLAALMSFSFTSCEEDEAIARTLEGTWEGRINAYTRTYNGSSYSPSRVTVTFNKHDNYWSTGGGYWMETYDRDYWGRGSYFRSHITWNVTGGDINIRFIDDGDRFIKINDYRLNEDRFVGYFPDGRDDVEFTLYHVSSPNWGAYSTWGWDGYYYGNEAQLDTEETK